VNNLDTQTNQPADYNDVLELCYEGDDHIYFRTRKVYTYEDSQVFFKYRYVVYCSLIDEVQDGCPNHIIVIEMAIEPEYINFGVLYDMAYGYGLEGTDYTPNCVDIMRESGYPIKFIEEGINLEFKPWLEQDAFVNKINIASAIIDTIDEMRSSYLDKAWNKAGTTGWDSVNYLLYGIDPIKEALSKYLLHNSQY
jgi:hypothetical protein